MKYYTRLNLYKASNVTYNPETGQAYSYGWWKFVDVINGRVVFNEYFYSQSTCGHQSKVRRLLRELGIKVNLVIDAPDGLQNLHSAVIYMQRNIERLQREINKPRTHKKKNAEREYQINLLRFQIDRTLELIKFQESEAA